MPKTIYTNGVLVGNLKLMTDLGDWQKRYRLEEIAASLGYMARIEQVKSTTPFTMSLTSYNFGPVDDDEHTTLVVDNTLNAVIRKILGCEEIEGVAGKTVQAFYLSDCLCGFRTVPKPKR